MTLPETAETLVKLNLLGGSVHHVTKHVQRSTPATEF